MPFSQIQQAMDINSAVQVDRGVFKRPQRSNDLESENMVKKPALVNPLQEVNNAPSAGRHFPNSPLVTVVQPQPAESVEKKAPVTKELSMQEIVDEHDRDNQLNFSPYAQRIVDNWLKVEDKFRVLPNYLDGQTDVKPYMRETLIDWIVDVNNHFHHRRETLYLCTNIVDRYVAAVIRDKSELISRANYQLVGVAAYLIASKYEEIYYPEIRNILQFADDIYNEEEVKRMEVKIVNTLKYDLTVPTTNKFLNRFLRVRRAPFASPVVVLEQERALHVLLHLRSHAPVISDAPVEALRASGRVDLSGAEVPGVQRELGGSEWRE